MIDFIIHRYLLMDSSVITTLKLSELETNGFYDHFLHVHQPLLITDIFNVYPALKALNIDYIAKKYGENVIDVKVSDRSGIFTLDPETGKPYFNPARMTIKEYVRTCAIQSANKKIYAQQISIFDNIPEFKNELQFLHYIPDYLIDSANLWLGAGGNTTALHFDGANNFFMQLFGEKKILLYSPKYFHELYPHSWKSKASHISPVDASKLDYTKYPNAIKAQKIELTISAGSILFLPAYWWHQVHSVNINVSINIWCKPSMRQKMYRGYLHSLLNEIAKSSKLF